LLGHLSSESALVGVLTDNPQQPLPIYDAEFDMDYMVTNKTYSKIDVSYTQLEQNPYIPKDLKLVMTKFTEELIMTENSTHRVWFKYNTSLKKPIAIISLLIFIKDWQDYKVISNIHCNIVLTIARNKLAYYSMAGYGAEITVESPGIVIKVTGWNEGIYNYLEEILKIFTISDSSYFSSMKDSYDYTLQYQEDQESYEKAINFLSRLITPYFTSLPEQYTQLQNLTEVDYTYLLYALPYCSLDILVLGNLNVPKGILDIFDKYFVATESEKQYRHSFGIEGYNIFTAPTQVENAIFNWYEYGFYDPKTYVTLQLLDVQTSDLAYRMLRSQAQLGYTVSMSSYDGFLTNGLYLVVQGDKYNPQEMQEYIDMFWTNVSISETEFDEIKQTMKSTTVPSTTYEDMYEDIWYEITTGRLGFFEMTEWLKEIDEVSLDDIKSFIEKIIEHENELSIRMYVDMSEATEKSISIDYYRDANKV
jgi:secreted Zn-dependent insulinase-like peptidase